MRVALLTESDWLLQHTITHWDLGAGIPHRITFGQYACPNGLMIGSDSHTPNAAGLGMLGTGVGGMEAVDVMAGLAYEVIHPKLIGVKLIGQLIGWASPKGKFELPPTFACLHELTELLGL